MSGHITRGASAVFGFALVAFLVSLPSSSSAKEWYEYKGTLHQKNLGEWARAGKFNRLATAGDMLAKVLGARKIRRRGGMNYLRLESAKLVICVNEVATDKNLHSQKVSGIAAGCIILLDIE